MERVAVTASEPASMAELVAARDWGATPLGPMAAWPEPLKAAVGICLKSRFPMFVWWGEKLINIYNDGYAPILGRRHPAALGAEGRELWREVWPAIGGEVEAVMKRGVASWHERVPLVVERNGFEETAYFTWSHSPIPDGRGGVGGLFCVVTEETRQILAERDRDLLAAQLRMSLDAAKMGWWHYDPVTGAAEWDERFKEIFGVTEEAQAGADVLAKLHPEDRPRMLAAVQAALAPADPKPYSIEYRVVHADGAVRWVEAHGMAVFAGEGAGRQAVNFVGTVADITERKREEEATRTILESITDAFFALDGEWRFTYINPQGNRVLSRAAGELQGKVIWDEYPGLAGSEFEKAYRKVARERVAASVTSYYPDHQRWYEVRTYPAADGISVYFRDVTEQKKAEMERDELLTRERAARAEAERASEAKSEFLSVLSHELRTPLTPVLLTVSVMEKHPGLPADLRADVEMIRRNVELESQLISDLLDLTRVSTGKLALEEREVDLHDIVRAAAEICRRADAAALVVELGAERHHVRGDDTRLQQIFWNLINNALKFTPAAGTVTVRSVNDADGRIRVEVSDTGQGIDPAVLPRLFTAFEQGEVRASRQQAGLGLGLAISRRLAEAHGGTITAASAGRGKGATFMVSLATVAAGAAAPRRPVEECVPAVYRRLNILLVEDHEATLKVMTKLLKGLGHEVSSAMTVAGGVEAALAGEFDLIVSDLGLPDGSGLELMRRVRGKYAGRAIAVTGFGMESDVAASKEAGFSAHLTKPVDFAALEGVILRVAGRG